MIARLATALLLAVASVVLLGSTPAYACRCTFGDVSRQANAADAVFVGSFPRADRTVDGGRITFLVAVRDVYQGEASAEMTVRAPYASATCGLDSIPAGKPVVWFTRGTGTEVRSDLCSGTSTLTPQLTRRLERVIGPPAVPGASGGGPSAAPSDSSADGNGAGSEDSTGDRTEGADDPSDGSPLDGLPWWAWALVGLTGAAVLVVAAGAAGAAATRRRAP